MSPKSDDPRDQAALIQEHVVEREIVVHHLRPQLRIAGRHVGVEAIEDPLHHRPPGGVGD